MSINKISILIPTVEYNKFLDDAIQSCFEAKYIKPTIYININSQSKKYTQSKYWNDKRIQWRYATQTGVSMYENVNDAIKNSEGEWIFILSDDDIIKENFMKDIDLSNKNYDFMYCVNQIELIDEKSKHIVNVSRCIRGGVYTSTDIIVQFLAENLRQHISLLCFSRTLCNQIGHFSTQLGYPNGYYGDYVFFGKAIANASSVYVEKNIVFSRRESSTQGSAKFYFQNITEYFDLITNDLYSNKQFKYYIDKYYGSRENYRIEMMKHRATIEWSKLKNKTYNHSKMKFLQFLYYLITNWKVPKSFKLCFITAKITSIILSKNLDSLYKRNIHLKFCKIKKFF